MKFRLAFGKFTTVEEPFKIQYKKGLFWHDFQEYDDDRNTTVIPYFSLANGIKVMERLALGMSKKCHTLKLNGGDCFK